MDVSQQWCNSPRWNVRALPACPHPPAASWVSSSPLAPDTFAMGDGGCTILLFDVPPDQCDGRCGAGWFRYWSLKFFALILCIFVGRHSSKGVSIKCNLVVTSGDCHARHLSQVPARETVRSVSQGGGRVHVRVTVIVLVHSLAFSFFAICNLVIFQFIFWPLRFAENAALLIHRMPATYSLPPGRYNCVCWLSPSPPLTTSSSALLANNMTDVRVVHQSPWRPNPRRGNQLVNPGPLSPQGCDQLDWCMQNQGAFRAGAHRTYFSRAAPLSHNLLLPNFLVLLLLPNELSHRSGEPGWLRPP